MGGRRERKRLTGQREDYSLRPPFYLFSRFMYFWSPERVQDVKDLNFEGLPGVQPVDNLLVTQLKEDVYVRHVVEGVLMFINQSNVAFSLPHESTGEGVADTLKKNYVNFRDVPFRELPLSLSSFVNGIRTLYQKLRQFDVLGFGDQDQEDCTLFDWLDRYERLVTFRADFQRGIHPRHRNGRSIPIGKPFLTFENPGAKTLQQAVRAYAPGYNPLGSRYNPSQGKEPNPEYYRHTGTAGRVLSAVGLNKPYRMTDIKAFLPVLQSSIVPQLEDALGHYTSARSFSILENLLAVRANVDQILANTSLDAQHQTLHLEQQVVTGIDECRRALAAFLNIRVQLYDCLQDIKEQANVTQQLLAKDSVLPQEILHIRSLLNMIITMLYPATDAMVDLGLHQTLGAGVNDSYEPAYCEGGGYDED